MRPLPRNDERGAMRPRSIVIALLLTVGAAGIYGLMVRADFRASRIDGKTDKSAGQEFVARDDRASGNADHAPTAGADCPTNVQVPSIRKQDLPSIAEPILSA